MALLDKKDRRKWLISATVLIFILAIGLGAWWLFGDYKPTTEVLVGIPIVFLILFIYWIYYINQNKIDSNQKDSISVGEFHKDSLKVGGAYTRVRAIVLFVGSLLFFVLAILSLINPEDIAFFFGGNGMIGFIILLLFSIGSMTAGILLWKQGAVALGGRFYKQNTEEITPNS